MDQNKKHRIFFWGITLPLFFVALGIRLGYYISDSLIARDGILYLSLLEQFVSSDNLLPENSGIFHVPPLFFIILRWIMRFGLSPKESILAVNIFCGATIPVLLFWLLLKLRMGTIVSLSIAGITVVLPFLVEISIQLLREPLCLFFLFCSATVIAYAPSRIRILFAFYGFWAAFFVSCGCFIRAEAIVCFAFFTLLWLYKGVFCKKSFTGMLSWCSGVVTLIVIISLNYPPSKMFLYFTERVTGVLR